MDETLLRDTLERCRRLEEQLRVLDEARSAAEARFARLYDSGIVGILISGLDSHVVDINDALVEMLGYRREEILSEQFAWKALTPPEWNEVDRRALSQLATSRTSALREKEYLRKDGRRVPVLAASAMLDGAEAHLCISFVIDLTEQKRAQDAMLRLRAERESEAQFRDLLETAPDAMVIAGEDGLISLVNAQVETLFGYTRAELLGQPIALLIPERDRGAHQRHRADHAASPDTRSVGAGVELQGRRKDGSEFPIEVSLSPLKTKQGLLVSSAIRDISERKKAEMQRARLAAIVEASDDAIIGKTVEGIVTSWNRGAERIFGFTAEEMLGRPSLTIIPPALMHEELEILAAAARGEIKHFDTRRLRKDGSEIDVAITTSPLRDLSGRVVGISKVAHDITARVEAETALARAKETAESASRELEAFSYSVAHDLRAPLRGMNGFARILLEDYGDKLDAEGVDCLNEIHSNAQKMGALIDALLSLSRVSRGDWKPERVDLSALVREIAAELAAASPERKVRVIAEEHLAADADPRLARALLENLLGNAWKFTASAAAARIEFGAEEKDCVRSFFVRDNGAGFDMAYAGKLFAPFQRLHTTTEFPGTGIGLATVQRIVHRHGGSVWAEGKVSQGATIHFTLGPNRGGDST